MSENLKIWDVLGKTDPKQTKPFKRGGGFTGTAVKPIYTTKKMTEEFGPCGIGWGFTEPQFQIVLGDNREVMVYCWLSLWIMRDGQKSALIPGVGGDKVVSHIKANAQYNRPERWENDDEAFKKAFTDAIGNAMKHIGMSADVHMGLFDDSKYVREVAAELAEETAPKKEFVPAVSSAAIALGREINQCKTLLDLNRLKKQPEFVQFWKEAHNEDRAYVASIANECKAKLEVNILQAGE